MRLIGGEFGTPVMIAPSRTHGRAVLAHNNWDLGNDADNTRSFTRAHTPTASVRLARAGVTEP